MFRGMSIHLSTLKMFNAGKRTLFQSRKCMLGDSPQNDSCTGNPGDNLARRDGDIVWEIPEEHV